MVTVIIATANRPKLLRTALESVAAQTALDKVSRIYVSENGGCPDSGAVCREFPSLPITYIYREPVTPLEHAKLIMREFLDEGELVAILHDDDWWAPTHLASAVRALETHPEAAAYGACHYVVAGESSMLNCSGNLFPWFGSTFATFQPAWELSRLNVLMGELLGTIAHYSSLVVRRAAMRQVTYIYDLNNPFDNDRMLIFALSLHGTFLYNPVPDTFVRAHAVQDCLTFNHEARAAHMCDTTRWMVGASGRTWEAVATAFYKRLTLCPPEAYGTLVKLALAEWCAPELSRQSGIPLARIQRRGPALAAAA